MEPKSEVWRSVDSKVKTISQSISVSSIFLMAAWGSLGILDIDQKFKLKRQASLTLQNGNKSILEHGGSWFSD